MRQHVRSLLAVIVVLNLLGLWAPPALAQPVSVIVGAQINVDTYDDEWDSGPQAAGTHCSLREALALAGDEQGGDRGCGGLSAPAAVDNINLNPGTYQLTKPIELPNIPSGDTVNILNSGATIDGGSQSGRHLGIFVVVGGTLNLKKITLRHGSRPGGGAIWLQTGTVTADDVKFKNNDAASDPALNGTGGAILVDTGALTVTNSEFQDNHSYQGGGAVATNFGYFSDVTFIGNKSYRGGAVYIMSPTTYPVIFYKSTFKQNLARPQLDEQEPQAGYTNHGDISGGGAIFNNGNLQLTRTILENNKTELNKGGGGMLNQGTAQLLESAVFSNNSYAKGSSDSNSFISYAWGGGIFNIGPLNLVRSSVYNNQADYAGGIFNTQAELALYNSTVSNNTGRASLGGIVNEHPLFNGAVSIGGKVHLLHSTVGKNNPSAPAQNLLYTLHDRSVIFANSILDGGCNQEQYTHGNSVITGSCATLDDPTISPQIPNADIISTSSLLDLQILPLSPGSLPISEVQVQRIQGTSNAVDIGRDDQYGCNNTFIARKDQNLAGRTTVCDAGSIEGGQNPPQFSSNPGPGLVAFPVVDLNSQTGTSTVNLVLHNTGGGLLSYQVELGTGSPLITLLSNPTGQIGKNSQFSLSFQCAPTVAGDQWRIVTISTNAENKKKANYKFRCTGAGQAQQASTSDPPGPLSMPEQPPGQTSHASLAVSNPGQQPLSASYAWQDSNPMWGAGTAQLADAQGQAVQQPDSPAVTINPGQTLTLDLTCSAGTYGLFLNTFVITTSDPINHRLQYDAACEALVSSPPEPLHPDQAYTTTSPSQFYGVAVSPNGALVLAGQLGNGTLRMYNRNAATGRLTAAGTLSAGGMTGIADIKFSRDGQNAYYSSEVGDGVVVLNTSPGIGVSQVITSGTLHVCGPLPLHPCPIGTMHGARGLAVSPDGQYVYVAGYSDGTLTVFRRLANGNLSYAQAITHTINGVEVLGGAARVTTSPDGQHIYVAALTADTLAVFQRTATGHLDFQAAYKDGMPGFTYLNQPSDVAVTPDGNFVYVTAAVDNAINVFSRSAADGLLTFSSVVTGVTGAYGLATTSDLAAERLFVAQYSADRVQVFGRDALTGALSSIGFYDNVPSVSNIDGPLFIAVSPDNMDIYVSMYTGQALRLFQTSHNQPVLTYLSPASAVAGSGAFVLTAHGGRFYPDSRILWAGTPQTTVFVSENELQATISGALITNQASFNVSVRNSSPGGGDTLPQPFVSTGPATPPIPSIESTDPAEIVAGADDILVYVQGANFAPDAQVFFNHIPVPTLFINDHVLQITLWATLLEQPGTAGLQVTNGGAEPALEAALLSLPEQPATASSQPPVGFVINPPDQQAQPSLTRIEPASVLSGSAETWVTVIGHNFSMDTPSVGRWNGLGRVSVVLDENTLLMSLTQDDLATAGNGAITVLTPGTGESTALTFRVRAPGEKPVPVLSSVMPTGFTLYVNGSDFDPAAQIRFNGVARPVTFVNSDQLKLTLSPADHAAAITVFNPAPGGGTSNALIAFMGRLFLPIIWR